MVDSHEEGEEAARFAILQNTRTGSASAHAASMDSIMATPSKSKPLPKGRRQQSRENRERKS